MFINANQVRNYASVNEKHCTQLKCFRFAAREEEYEENGGKMMPEIYVQMWHICAYI